MILISPSNVDGRSDTNLSEHNFNFPILNGPILNLEDTLLFNLINCAATAEVCMGIALDDISNYQVTVNGAQYTNGIAPCDFDTTNLYSYATLFGQGDLGPYILQTWEINASVFSTPFNNIPELVDSMNSWDPTGNWVNNTVDKIITGGTPGNTYGDMDVFVLAIGSNNILGHNDNFDPQGTMVFINSGVTELIVTESLTGDSDTALIVASCAQLDTLIDNTFVGVGETFCLDFSELPGDVESVTNICPTSNIDFQLINGDSCVLYTGLLIGSDTACFVACDGFGICDTTYLMIESLQAMGNQEIFDTLMIGESAQWCVDQSIFMGTVDTIYNICPGASGTFTEFVIDPINFCVDYTGLASLGTEQGCFVVCDDLNNCDTTTINTTVRRVGPSYYYDTLYVNQEGFFCDWDVTNLFGPIVNIENGCVGMSGTEVMFDVDVTNFCIGYDAMDVGKDTACIYLTDNTGAMDTTFAIICVLQPETEMVLDTIRITVNPTYCVDTTQLAGDITSIENICPDDSGEAIDFVIDSTTFCITANPIMLGTDSACIVICDEFGICDTTIFAVTVTEDAVMMEAPIAFDDTDSTTLNNSIIVNSCLNDSIPVDLPITNFFVLPVASGGVGPLNGTAFSNTDCTVSYVPNDDYCGDDEITYVICNAVGCDTAMITIAVICPDADFKIFNAFSPNGDGVNDFFKINGVQQFPDHMLYVFNRWGNEVLKVSDYQNDWGATWQGADLPDGTYYYVFDTGEGDIRSGYVYIGR